MIERAHHEAYRIAAEKAAKLAAEGKWEEAHTSHQQMAVIHELEKARKEIFAKFGVPDVEVELEDLPFGSLLRKFRLEAGLSLRQLANKTGLTPAKISRIERNVTNKPLTPEELKRTIVDLGLNTDGSRAKLLVEKSGIQTAS